jgi:2-polyprenyl-6-hydroxyphenyl methylase/3-demethylubiquinone-9 3-methyltransferase
MCDKALPIRFRVDGNSDYRNFFVGKFLRNNSQIYDIGGGKQPFISIDLKKTMQLSIVGIDISEEELIKAPCGAYDKTICVDIAKYRGHGDADLLICQAVLEHVRDVEGAFRSISSCLKSGGVACIFVPSRNAVFARLNLILPESIKRVLLFTIFPQTRSAQGFPSYYNCCSPSDFIRLGKENGMDVLEARYYYMSNYFSFFTPLYLLWRIWILSFWLFKGDQAAETFSVALVKR